MRLSALKTKHFIYLSLFTLFSYSFSGINDNKETNQNEKGTLQFRFDFGNGNLQLGYTKVTGDMVYDKKRGFGFVSEDSVISIDRKGKNALTSDFCTSNKPFYFVLDIPEGNYEVKITFGDRKGISRTTVKAESRRLMLEDVKTAKGKFITKTITINIRTPKINSEENIHLKSRELAYLNWDDKLTLEFNNERPCINAVEIKEIKDIITVFLAGNSTVVDQEYEPWYSWGQMITRFFNEKVAIANFAESGEALKSFQSSGRLKKILSLMKPGDYLFIKFGHNDQKPQSSTYVKAFTGYQEELKKFIRAARNLGGNPVLINSTQRRNFDENGKIINTHGDYPEAVRQTAKEENVHFIDLTGMSKDLYEALGIEGSKKAFVYYPANSFPGQDKELADNSHFNPYGAYQLAKCIIKGIRENNLELANYLIDAEPYNPSKPDSFEAWNLPSSPSFQSIKPDRY